MLLSNDKSEILIVPFEDWEATPDLTKISIRNDYEKREKKVKNNLENTNIIKKYNQNMTEEKVEI